MFLELIQFALFALINKVSGQTEECFDAFECESQPISSTTDISCFGFGSCTESDITAPDTDCHGSFSCYNATNIESDTVQCMSPILLILCVTSVYRYLYKHLTN